MMNSIWTYFGRAHGRPRAHPSVCPRMPTDAHRHAHEPAHKPAHRCARAPTDAHGCPRAPMDAHGCLWIPKCVHGRPNFIYHPTVVLTLPRPDFKKRLIRPVLYSRDVFPHTKSGDLFAFPETTSRDCKQFAASGKCECWGNSNEPANDIYRRSTCQTAHSSYYATRRRNNIRFVVEREPKRISAKVAL